MKSYRKHKPGHRHGLISKYKQHFKFLLFLLALVLVMIGNNFASFRSDDQPIQGSYTGRNYSPENYQGTGNVQEGMSPIHHNAPFMTEFGGGRERQIESMIAYALESVWSNSGQHDKYYIQSALHLQNDALTDWADYLLASLGSSAQNHPISEQQLASLLNLSNQEGGGGGAPGHVFGALEYPHSTNYGGGYGGNSEGGSAGLSGSGGGSNDDLHRPQQAEPTPEPSTLILTGIGMLLLARRTYSNRDHLKRVGP